MLGGVCEVEICGVLCSNGGNICVAIQINITLVQLNDMAAILNCGSHFDSCNCGVLICYILYFQ